MSPDPTLPDVLTQLDALAAYIRDPQHVTPPADIEERRLQVYRDLFFNNVDSLLAGNFPVLRKIYGDERWQVLIRDFYRDHDCRTPLFTELAREFLRYLEHRSQNDDRTFASDEPWLYELAHYEWVELALQISEACNDDVAHDPSGDLLQGRPLLSPLAWPLAYRWPVNRIGPDFLPQTPPEVPTLLMLRREVDGDVSFHALTPLTFRMLQRLDAEPQLSGQEHLQALATEAGTTDIARFIDEGLLMLEQMHREGTVLGTRLD